MVYAWSVPKHVLYFNLIIVTDSYSSISARTRVLNNAAIDGNIAVGFYAFCVLKEDFNNKIYKINCIRADM